MARFSTGLRNAVAVNYGLGIMMNGGIIRVYGGTLPATPDDPPGTTELATITTDGNAFFAGADVNNAGLLLSFVEPGGLTKVGQWRLKGKATGTATWWRWSWANPDSFAFDTLLPRVDGRVGTELVLGLTAITPSTDFEIEQFLFVLPMGD